MAKHRKSNKSIKKTKKHRQSKKSYRGGCGCSNNTTTTTTTNVMKGGYGPSNFSSLPSSHYYGLTNPNDLSLPQSSRIMSGGKKNKKSKKMYGGVSNYIESTGNTSGAGLGSNLINGIPNPSNSITDGPLLNISSVYNA
jgi:hypothetical protein